MIQNILEKFFKKIIFITIRTMNIKLPSAIRFIPQWLLVFTLLVIFPAKSICVNYYRLIGGIILFISGSYITYDGFRPAKAEVISLIGGLEYYSDDMTVYVTGAVKNNGECDIKDVKIFLAAYDSEGNRISWYSKASLRSTYISKHSKTIWEGWIYGVPEPPSRVEAEIKYNAIYTPNSLLEGITGSIITYAGFTMILEEISIRRKLKEKFGIDLKLLASSEGRLDVLICKTFK
jgi:hypothetical protein